MNDLQISSTAVDLSRLPAPDVVEQLSYETIYAENLAAAQALMPDFDAAVESDPVVKLLQAFAYRELLLRQQFNDRARQVMVAFATGSNLDQLGAIFGVARLVLDAGDAELGIVATLEADEDFRLRIVLAPESYSVAGPELAYVYHAKSADADVLDASATSPEPGEVLISVLSRLGNGTASAELLAKVAAVVNSPGIRPLGDAVTVASAGIRPFELEASLVTYSGPDTSIVLAAARAKLDAYLAESRKLGRDITTSGLIAALTVPGVQKVVLASPVADVVCTPVQAAYCYEITITHGGYGY